MQDPKIAKNSPSGHHRKTLSGYIFATKAHIDNRKKLLNSSVSPTSAHNVVNFGRLAADIRWRVWALQRMAPSSGRQPNFAALNRGRQLYSAGRPSRWALAHISSLS